MRSEVFAKPILAALLLCAAFACAPTGGPRKAAHASQTRERMAGAELVAGYRRWTRVNPEPAVLHARRATDCALPTGERPDVGGDGNPHREKFINVYVNDAGRRAMLEQRWPRFPAGSLIVKEKLPGRDEGVAPELLTVMLKREAGYDPEGGDWEYVVLDGRGEGVRARGKLESCRGCHLSAKDTDFVARHYLPRDIFRKLK